MQSVQNEHKDAAILVSQYFPPFNMVASQRAMRMAVTLLNKYEQVYVITLPVQDLPDEFLDFEFGKELLQESRLKVITASPVLNGYGFVKQKKLFHRLIGGILTRLLCGPGVDWIPSLKAVLLPIINQCKVKLIVATGVPFIPFYTIIKFAELNNIPSILDYRDLWSQNPHAPYPKFARYLVRATVEKYVNGHATVVTTVSDGCARSLAKQSNSTPVKILPNYPDNFYKKIFAKSLPTAISSVFDRNTLNIVLTGSIYKNCTCRLLVESLKLMSQEWRGRVRLHYFGPTSKIVENDFSSQDIFYNLIDHGFVSKSKAIQVLKEADLLLSLVFDGPVSEQASIQGLMTTKVFDYLLSGKPILNIGPPNGDINILAQKIGYSEFYSFEYFQIQEVSDFLLSALQNIDNFRKRKVQVELPDFSECFIKIISSVDEIA